MTRFSRWLLSVLNKLLRPLGWRVVTGKRFGCDRFPASGRKEYLLVEEKPAQVVALSIVDAAGKTSGRIDVGEPITLQAEIVVRRPVARMNVSFMIHDDYEPFVSATHSAMTDSAPTSWAPGRYIVRARYPQGLLNRGVFYVRVGLGWVDNTVYDFHDDGLRLEVAVAGEVEPHSIHSHGLLAVIPEYEVETIGQEAD